MHINSFHLTHFHSCVPVLIGGVWTIVQFYLSSVGDMFFSSFFFHINQPQNVFRLQAVFQFGGIEWILRRLICSNMLQSLLPEKPTHQPKLTQATSLRTTERVSITSTKLKTCKERRLPSPAWHSQWADTVFQSSRHKNDPCITRRVLWGTEAAGDPNQKGSTLSVTNTAKQGDG